MQQRGLITPTQGEFTDSSMKKTFSCYLLSLAYRASATCPYQRILNHYSESCFKIQDAIFMIFSYTRFSCIHILKIGGFL